MIAALQKGRQGLPVSSSGTIAAVSPEANTGEMDMQKCMADMSSKLDKILALLNPGAADGEQENPNNGNPDE